jgi:sporulation and spore germination protein
VTGRHPRARVVLIAVLTAVLAAALTAGCGVRPSGVIIGGPAPTKQVMDGSPPLWGATLYFVAGPALTTVDRPTRQRLPPAQVLALLQAGPDGDERAAGLTSEVPAGLDAVAVTAGAGTVEVVVSADVTALSATAVDQIVCTVRDALPTPSPVTLTSGTASRGPRTCPVAG